MTGRSASCAIGTDGKILRVNTLDVSSETKTLGGKTANPEYTDQYTGQDETLAGVNAISGATITSTAYRGCVETAFAAFETIKGGGKMTKLQNLLKGLIKENPVFVPRARHVSDAGHLDVR